MHKVAVVDVRVAWHFGLFAINGVGFWLFGSVLTNRSGYVWIVSSEEWIMRIFATIGVMFRVGRYTHVLRDVGRILANSFLKALHKVHEILHWILLLANLALVAGVVYYIIEHTGWIYVTLICIKHLCEKMLKLSSHRIACFHSLDLDFIWLLVNWHLHASNRVEKEFFSHVWQKEEGLNEGVEVAGVAYVLKSNRDTILAHSLV
jgi:hypothetical protein